jgi:hypothetical protein
MTRPSRRLLAQEEKWLRRSCSAKGNTGQVRDVGHMLTGL